VPCALPGAELPGGFRIKVAKVRGVESSGMLCSARELGIAEDAAGLLLLAADAPVGEDIRRHLDLDDRLLTLKLTPNRADCLSLEGVAREVAALTGTPARFTEVERSRSRIADRARRRARRARGLPALLRRVIAGVDGTGADPGWMSGASSAAACADLGAGRHHQLRDARTRPAAARFRQQPPARRHPRPHGAAGEKISLLNEQTWTLQPDILLIADEQRRWRWPASWAAKTAASPWPPPRCSSNRPSSRRRRLPGAPVAMASSPTPRIVSSAASISAARGARSSVPRAWFSISAAARPGR
jgi:phenylalanyl-tRNA synthetase beta chain